ncbi:MAG: hypothetical protein DRQ46_10190 [Gammaproteobacteria bacterium]|nr:MAG: hypothetical protein DRQ46_10190 [Gammaproteobacteria bacterium]
MIKKGSIEYNGVWGFRGKFFTLEGACVTDWEATGKQLLSHDIMYDEVQWVDPEPWRGEKVWVLAEARACCRMLAKRTDVIAIRLIKFDKNEEGVLTILDICEFESQTIVTRYPYGSYIDTFITEWCEARNWFSFEIVLKEAW